MKLITFMLIGFFTAMQGSAQSKLTIQQEDSILPCLLKVGKFYPKEKDRIYALIENQVRFLRAELHNWNGDSTMKLITKSGSGEHEIRPNATFAGDLSFLCRFGDFDAQKVGVSRKELLNNDLIPVLRYLVRTHKTGDLKTNNGKSWGDAWQSAHWASAVANAAWWSWKDLPTDIQRGARRVVAHEADRIADMEPPHQVKLDSKSEENAWNSQILSAALILMPTDSRYHQWEKSLQKWAFSAYLRAADSSSLKTVDGIPVAKRYTGANIYNDFTLENHNIVHPDYMGAWIMNAGNDLDYLMTGRKPLQAFLYNLPQIYENQKRLLLPDGGYIYPNGQDWALFRNPDWMTSHATAVARFNDPEALYFLHAALITAEKMQQRNKNGAIYGPGENYFPSAQSHLAYWLVQSWLVLQYSEQPLKQKRQNPGVNYFEEGKFIINRTKNTIHSVAWGEKPMLQLMALDKDHVISPDQRNGIGRITIGGKVLPINIHSVHVDHGHKSFIVHLIIDHGNEIRADIICTSKSDGRLEILEKLTALKDCQTDNIRTLSFGILNNPQWVYEMGERTLQLGAQCYIVNSASGKHYRAKANRVRLDKLEFKLDKPATITYQTAKKMFASRYTDILVLNALEGTHFWQKGDSIAENKVIIKVK